MKKNVIIVILVVLVLGMGGYLVYDKVIDNNTISKESVVESKDSNDLKVGEVGQINFEIESRDCGEESGTVKIENGKLVYISESGKKIEDTSLNEKAISVVSGAVGCDCGSSSFIVLTEKGNVYYNYLTDENNYNFKFNLTKVLSDEKIYGIDAFDKKAPTTCEGQQFYAYINKNKDDAKIIELNYADTPYLGNSYSYIYPYEEYVSDGMGPYLAIEKNGKLKLIAGFADSYLIYDRNYIYVDSKEDISIIEYKEENKYGYKMIDKNNNYYELTITLSEDLDLQDLKLVKIK